MTIHTGDCIEVMADMEADSVDAVVTDPPYGLEFMGKGWDKFGARFRKPSERDTQRGAETRDQSWSPATMFVARNTPDAYVAGTPFQAWCEAWGREALRVTKPGGYLLAFGGTRTHHRLVCGLEDAGWIIRDELDWIYACLSDDTEIYTLRGWVNSYQVRTTDHALAFDQDSGALRWEPIEAVHRYDHEGEMVRVVGAGTDQLVTLNHRLVLVDGPGVAPLPGVPSDVLAARGVDAPGVQGTVLLEAMQRDATHPRSSIPAGTVMERRAQGEGIAGDAWAAEPGMEGRRYRLSEARQLLRSALRSSAGVGTADGPQGRLHHGAPPTDGGPLRLPDDQGRSGEPREPRPDRQSARESNPVALEPGPQAVRVDTSGDRWRVMPSGPVSAAIVGYAGVVWCVTVPSGAFVARRGGVAFVTGNSGFPKGKANLKPAHEPIVLARKPGPLQPLQIDATRIPSDDGYESAWDKPISSNAGNVVMGTLSGTTERKTVDISANKPEGGRWPSNLLLSDPELFDEPNPYVVGSGATMGPSAPASGPTWTGPSGSPSRSPMKGTDRDPQFYDDSGGYSRFFIIPKADRADREPIVRGQLADTPAGALNMRTDAHSVKNGMNTAARANSHPTVKPTDLMRHLVRLVTPPGGTVLDCFLGSGSTAIACELEGFPWIGIEKEPEYVAIAEARLNGTQRGLGLDVPAPQTRRKTQGDQWSMTRDDRVRNPGRDWLGFAAGHKPDDEEPAA